MDFILRFTGKNIPIATVSKIIGKDQRFVKRAMIEGTLPIGTAMRKQGSSEYDFYVSPKLLYEFTGFFVDDNSINATEQNWGKEET